MMSETVNDPPLPFRYPLFFKPRIQQFQIRSPDPFLPHACEEAQQLRRVVFENLCGFPAVNRFEKPELVAMGGL